MSSLEREEKLDKWTTFQEYLLIIAFIIVIIWLILVHFWKYIKSNKFWKNLNNEMGF